MVPFSLHIVELDNVIPHECVDPRRVNRLAQRLREEKVLRNPPIAIRMGNKYIVLDGATRTIALKQLGFPHIVVQVVSPEDGLKLHTWHHVIQQIETGRLVELLSDLPAISLVETDAKRVAGDAVEAGGVCYMYTIEGQIYGVQPAPGFDNLESLNQFTTAYIEATHVERTLEKNMDSLRRGYPHMAALVVFCEYTVAEVIRVAQLGRHFPAGVTRFIISGRVLRLNMDLAFLKSDKPLRQKNQRLRQLLAERQERNRIRYYAEPVYLLDE